MTTTKKTAKLIQLRIPGGNAIEFVCCGVTNKLGPIFNEGVPKKGREPAVVFSLDLNRPQSAFNFKCGKCGNALEIWVARSFAKTLLQNPINKGSEKEDEKPNTKENINGK